jgi:hypothetical protein
VRVSRAQIRVVKAISVELASIRVETASIQCSKIELNNLVNIPNDLYMAHKVSTNQGSFSIPRKCWMENGRYSHYPLDNEVFQYCIERNYDLGTVYGHLWNQWRDPSKNLVETLKEAGGANNGKGSSFYKRY